MKRMNVMDRVLFSLDRHKPFSSAMFQGTCYSHSNPLLTAGEERKCKGGEREIFKVLIF